jgi:hypothetical protein
MRKLIVGAVAGVLVLAMAAVAMAETVQTYKQTFSQTKAGKSTGTTFSTSSIDEANTGRNKQPKRVTQFDITFPKGTIVNYKALPVCTATEEEFVAEANPDAACPAKSKIGSGDVKARIPFKIGADEELTGTVNGYNGKGQLLLFVSIQSPIGNQTLLIKGKLKSSKTSTTLKTTVPASCVPPGIPSNQCKDGTGTSQYAILTYFSLKVKPGTSGSGSKKKTYMTTPTKCSGGSWTFAADITYDDGTDFQHDSKTPCKK